MGKFKIGDRVRVVKDVCLDRLNHKEVYNLQACNDNIRVGDEFTIVNVLSFGSSEADYITEEGFHVSESFLELVNASDNINNPKHYTAGGVETIDYLKAKLTPEEYKGFLKGNIIKYLSRSKHKNAEIEDYKKAQWCMNKLNKI